MTARPETQDCPEIQEMSRHFIFNRTKSEACLDSGGYSPAYNGKGPSNMLG